MALPTEGSNSLADLVQIGVIFTIALNLLALTVLAVAEPMPFPKQGPCPSGYVESGGFCNPVSARSAPAVPKPRGAACPSGWRESGGACVEVRSR
jgi:hypothetical protein